MTAPVHTPPASAEASAGKPASSGKARLEDIFSASEILCDEASLTAHQVDGLRPRAVVQPAETAQVAEAVRFAASEKLSLIPSGGGTKLAIGAPPERYDIALDLSRMNRVLACDPDDLTLGVEPGIRVSDLLRVLREHKQFLPLAVPFGERATIGGVAAANSNSPLRHSYGGVRDFCLGMEFVTGEAELCKSGGRVVKNVTGYDLHKLLIGSLGTLAIITRVNFRMYPIPPAQRTFVASFSQASAAVKFCREIAKSVLSPQIVEIANPAAAGILSSEGAHFDAKQWSVVLASSGQAPVVERHARDLARLAEGSGAGSFATFEEAQEAAILSRICEFPRLLLEAAPDAIIFRISVLPSAMSALLSQLSELAQRNAFTFTALARASGFLYAAFVPGSAEAARHGGLTAAQVFQVCASAEIGARAMIEWCPAEVKREVHVWGPVQPDFELMQRLKKVFDPLRVFSPRRFAGGI